MSGNPIFNTAVLVFLGAFITAFSLFSSDLNYPSAKSLDVTDQPAMVKVDRSVASAGEGLSSRHSEVEISIGCEQSSSKQNGKASSDAILLVTDLLVQIKGKFCGDGRKVEVTNLANRVTGSFFLLEGKRFETDLMSLRKGDNIIVFQYETTSGQPRESKHILRVK